MHGRSQLAGYVLPCLLMLMLGVIRRKTILATRLLTLPMATHGHLEGFRTFPIEAKRCTVNVTLYIQSSGSQAIMP